MSQRHVVRSSQTRRLVRKLSAYAAAGASMFVAVPIGDVQASIIHIDFGPTGEQIPRFGTDSSGYQYILDGSAESDFDQDGAPEFVATFNSRTDDCGLRSNGHFRSAKVGIFGRRTQHVIVQSGQPLLSGALIRIDSAGAQNVSLAFRSACGGSFPVVVLFRIMAGPF